MSEGYIRFIQRHPFWILSMVLLLLIAAGAGVTRLSFTSDFRTYFSDQNPQLRAFEAMEDRFSRQDNLYFLIQSDATLFTTEGLQLIQTLTQEGWTLPYVQRVDSLQNFQYTEVDQDDLLINDFYRLDELPDDLQSLAEKGINDDDIVLKLLSPDTRISGISLQLNLPEENSSEASKEAVNAARTLLHQIRAQFPDHDISLGGSATSNVTMGEAIRQDIESLLIFSYLVMLVIMAVLLRTLSGVVLVTVLIGMSVLITMGIFGWAGYTLTPPTGFVPTAVMTIAVADTIHILVTYYFHLRQGDNREQALLASMKLNFSPVFITSITTMVGVLALNTSDSPPYRDMGNMIALGVMVAWALTITFLPAILQILPAPAQQSNKAQRQWPDRLADVVIRYRRGLFIGMLLIVAGSASFAPRNDVTERWHEFFDDSFEVRRTVDQLEQSLQGLHVLYFVADTQKDSGINSPEFLRQLDAFGTWLRAQPEVVHVTSLADTIKRLNRNLHNDQPEWYRIPETSEATAQYLLLYELSLPLGLGLETTMTSDRSATRLHATLHRTDSATIIRLEKEAVAWATRHAPLLNINETTGLDVVFANLTHRNVTAMLEGTGAALVIISLLMVGALRSWRMGLISMVPNMLPALMAYGLWGIIYGHIDTATSVVACLSLGIVVDDTVHFLSKYNHARLILGKSVEEAIRYAFHTVGVALLITSAILVGGFTVMEFSHFNPSRAMGLLLALTIAVALLIDFLLLPPLLMLTDRRSVAKQSGIDNTIEDKLNR